MQSSRARPRARVSTLKSRTPSLPELAIGFSPSAPLASSVSPSALRAEIRNCADSEGRLERFSMAICSGTTCAITGSREEVGVFDVAVAQADLLHHEARQAACFFVGRVIGETVQQLAEVVATREAELETQARRLEPCFGKGPRLIDDAAQFEIDQQAPEPDHRPALGSASARPSTSKRKLRG